MEQQRLEHRTFSEVYHALADIDERTGAISEKVTVFVKGDSKLLVRTPHNKLNTVLEVISKSEAKIMDQNERRNDIELMVGMGRSSTGTVYASSVKNQEDF